MRGMTFEFVSIKDKKVIMDSDLKLVGYVHFLHFFLPAVGKKSSTTRLLLGIDLEHVMN